MSPTTTSAQAAPRTTHQIAGVAGLVEPLSDRELEVLGLLSAGQVKPGDRRRTRCGAGYRQKHGGHILEKLGAANRTQAVVRAWALGLLRQLGSHCSIVCSGTAGGTPKIPPRGPPSGDAPARREP